MNIKLSILICSLEKRAQKLQKLLSVLLAQKTEEIEILTNIDNGEKTVGGKRNELIERSQGEYISFVDDDDLVSNDYVSKILKAIGTKPDCVGIEGNYFVNKDNKQRKLFHSLKYKTWTSDHTNYYRYPNHLNPVKREIAIKVGFKDINAGEDGDYSDRLLPYLKTEEYISGPIYYYYYSSDESETNINKNGLKYRNAVGGDFTIEATLRLKNSLSKDASFNYTGGSIKFLSDCVIKKDNQILILSLTKIFKLKVERNGEDVSFWIDEHPIKKVNYQEHVFRFSFDTAFRNLEIIKFELVLNGYKWSHPW